MTFRVFLNRVFYISILYALTIVVAIIGLVLFSAA